MTEGMSTREFAALRDRVGGYDLELAHELRVSVPQLREWVVGTRTAPPHVIERMRLMARLAETDRAMAVSGIPECQTVQALWSSLGDAIGSKRTEQVLAELDAHEAACETCRARARYADAHLGPRPAFPVLQRRGLTWWYFELPDATRRIISGAVPITAFVLSFAVLTRLASVPPFRQPWTELLVGVPLAAVLGAAFGGLYHLSRTRLLRYGYLGRLVSGLVLGAYVFVPLAVLAPYWLGFAFLDGPASVRDLVVAIAVLGIAMTATLNDDE
jgi:hypothetical protein